MFILLIRINVCQTFRAYESCDKTDSPKHILYALENTFRIININSEYEIVWVWNSMFINQNIANYCKLFID